MRQMRFLSRFFGKRSDEVRFSYEEKHYPLGVLILVFMMTIIIWSLGQRAFYDLSDGISRIEYPRHLELSEEKAVEESWEETLWPLYEKRNDLERRVREMRSEYDSSLLENISGETNRLYGDEDSIRSQFSLLQYELHNHILEVELTEAEHELLVEIAEEARKVAEKEYRSKNKWRQVKVFALEAVFWVPFFFLMLSWHTRSRRKQSKWEIISLSAYIAASLLALQSICTLLWSWIPRALLERLWEILSATILTRIIGYYLMVGLVILLFGSFIVFVHRRMTDPVRGGRKKIRQGGCPTCNYPLNLSDAYCGSCGKQLKTECGSCKATRYTWESVCSHCGTK